MFYSDIRAWPAKVSINANYIRVVVEEITETEISDTYLEKLTKSVEHEIEKKFWQQKTPINFSDLIWELHVSSEVVQLKDKVAVSS